MKGSFLSGRSVAIAQGLWRDVSLATDDRLNAGPFRGLVKLDRPVEIAVISNRNRRHSEFRSFSDQLFRSNRSIKQRILGVTM